MSLANVTWLGHSLKLKLRAERRAMIRLPVELGMFVQILLGNDRNFESIRFNLKFPCRCNKLVGVETPTKLCCKCRNNVAYCQYADEKSTDEKAIVSFNASHCEIPFNFSYSIQTRTQLSYIVPY